MPFPKRPAEGCRAVLAARAQAHGQPLSGSSEDGFSKCPRRGRGKLPRTRSAVSWILYDPPAAASEMPTRIKKTFRRPISGFIRCDKLLFTLCISPGCGAERSDRRSGLHPGQSSRFHPRRGSGGQPRSSQHLTIFSSLPSGTSSQHFLHCRWLVQGLFLEHTPLC